MAPARDFLVRQLRALFRRHGWVLVLNALSVAAFFHAHALGSLLGLRLGPDARALCTTPARDFAPEAPSVSRDLRAAVVAARNAFDSVTGPLGAIPGGASSPGDGLIAAITDPMGAPECDGVRVVAIAASSDAEWSLASLVPGDSAEPLLRRRGGAVAGKTVQFIGQDRVWLADGEGLCQAGMWQRPKASPARRVAATPKTELAREMAAGIHPVSATELRVERRVVEKILEHQAELVAGAHVMPDPEGGFRITGVKADSPLAQLGIQSGDRLESINGFDVTNPEKALEAYARLSSAPHLTVTVRRADKETNLDYDIQP